VKKFELFSEAYMTQIDSEYIFVSELEVRPNDLQPLLLRQKPNVLHFGGHGAQNGDIFLANSESEHVLINGSILATLLGQHKAYLKVIVLSSCFSDALASQIHSEGIDYVIGYTDSLNNQIAVAFSDTFYSCLKLGQDPKGAFESSVNTLGLTDDESARPFRIYPNDLGGTVIFDRYLPVISRNRLITAKTNR